MTEDLTQVYPTAITLAIWRNPGYVTILRSTSNKTYEGEQYGHHDRARAPCEPRYRQPSGSLAPPNTSVARRNGVDVPSGAWCVARLPSARTSVPPRRQGRTRRAVHLRQGAASGAGSFHGKVVRRKRAIE